MSFGVVNEIETMQVRNGDVILLKAKSDVSDAKILGICDQLRAWMDSRRIRVHVALVPHDVEIMIIREERKL